MNNLTRAQVLALLVSTTSAATLTAIELLNGPSDLANIPDSLQGNEDEDDNQALTNAMSGASCNGNADCVAENEKCGSFLATDTAAENFCVHTDFCAYKGALGYLNGVAWILQCWEDPESEDVSATAPAIPQDAEGNDIVIADYIEALEGMITKADENGNFPWDGAQNLIISPNSNYQDGWWLEGDDDKFTETDKTRDNRCYYSDTQCPPTDDAPDVERCCMQYPDTNSRRCMNKSLAGTTFYVGPALVLGRCEPDQPTGNDTGDDAAPTNAQDDIAEGALATASEDLNKWHTDQKTDAKENAGYDDMTTAEKEAWDQNYEDIKETREEFYAELRTLIGYDTDLCDDDGKAKFENELIVWEKAVYELCSDTPLDIACQNSQELKRQEDTARAGDAEDDTVKNYYCEMTDEERLAFDEARVSEIKASESSLAAAWMEDNEPTAGNEGSSCAVNKCTDPDHCCGTSTRKVGANVNDPLENICVDSTDLAYTDGLGREYTHVCNSFAKGLTTATAAAVATAASIYALM